MDFVISKSAHPLTNQSAELAIKKLKQTQYLDIKTVAVESQIYCLINTGKLRESIRFHHVNAYVFSMKLLSVIYSSMGDIIEI